MSQYQDARLKKCAVHRYRPLHTFFLSETEKTPEKMKPSVATAMRLTTYPHTKVQTQAHTNVLMFHEAKGLLNWVIAQQRREIDYLLYAIRIIAG
eukprot:scaffold3980_cov80-Skeletonema_dohrnii-CCMP3373.AAC.2